MVRYIALDRLTWNGPYVLDTSYDLYLLTFHTFLYTKPIKEKQWI